MMEYVISLSVSFAVAVLMLPLIIRVAHHYGWFDRMDGRKIHSGDVPRLGGIGIYLAVVAGTGVGLAVSARAAFALDYSVLDWFLFMIGLSAMFAVGLVDDFRNVPALRKLVGQLAAALVISLSGVRIENLQVPFTGTVFSIGVFSYPITILWIVLIANALNLIDGMDGFAGGVVLLASGAFGVIGAILGDYAVVVLALAVFGASAAFLLFNRPPAHIFMGDSGSLLLGTLLAVTPLLRDTHGTQLSPLSLFIPATILLLPVFDTVAAIFRRVRRRQPIHQPDSEHLHHKLLLLLGSTRSTLYLLYAYQVVLGALSVAYLYLTPVFGWCLLVAVWVASILFFAVTHRKYHRQLRAGYLENNALRQVISTKRSSKAI